MKFSETVLYATIMYPLDEADKSCFYIWLLKIPKFIIAYTIGIVIAVVIAVVIDFIEAMKG
jgi:hypothetical protein